MLPAFIQLVMVRGDTFSISQTVGVVILIPLSHDKAVLTLYSNRKASKSDLSILYIVVECMAILRNQYQLNYLDAFQTQFQGIEERFPLLSFRSTR